MVGEASLAAGRVRPMITTCGLSAGDQSLCTVAILASIRDLGDNLDPSPLIKSFDH
jgi:hypothetical protein